MRSHSDRLFASLRTLGWFPLSHKNFCEWVPSDYFGASHDWQHKNISFYRLFPPSWPLLLLQHADVDK